MDSSLILSKYQILKRTTFGQFKDKGNKRTQQYGITFRHYDKLLSFTPSPPQKKTHTHTDKRNYEMKEKKIMKKWAIAI